MTTMFPNRTRFSHSLIYTQSENNTWSSLTLLNLLELLLIWFYLLFQSFYFQFQSLRLLFPLRILLLQVFHVLLSLFQLLETPTMYRYKGIIHALRAEIIRHSLRIWLKIKTIVLIDQKIDIENMVTSNLTGNLSLKKTTLKFGHIKYRILWNGDNRCVPYYPLNWRSWSLWYTD